MCLVPCWVDLDAPALAAREEGSRAKALAAGERHSPTTASRFTQPHLRPRFSKLQGAVQYAISTVDPRKHRSSGNKQARLHVSSLAATHTSLRMRSFGAGCGGLQGCFWRLIGTGFVRRHARTSRSIRCRYHRNAVARKVVCGHATSLD